MIVLEEGRGAEVLEKGRVETGLFQESGLRENLLLDAPISGSAPGAPGSAGKCNIPEKD